MVVCGVDATTKEKEAMYVCMLPKQRQCDGTNERT